MVGSLEVGLDVLELKVDERVVNVAVGVQTSQSLKSLLVPTLQCEPAAYWKTPSAARSENFPSREETHRGDSGKTLRGCRVSSAHLRRAPAENEETARRSQDEGSEGDHGNELERERKAPLSFVGPALERAVTRPGGDESADAESELLQPAP